MFENSKSFLRFIVAFLVLCVFLVGSSSAFASDFKAAIVMPGVITDKSFNQQGYEGIMGAKEKLGIGVAYSEKVAQPDQPEALADYARRGYDVVIGYGGEFQDSVDRVASRYPDTMFIVANGVKTSKNVATVRFHYEALAYALGYIGGKMSKTGIGGFIGGQQIAYSLQQQTGFTNGFTKAQPGGKVYSAWTNDWDDIAKGKEAALSLISQQADVIFPTMDNAIIGSFQGVKEKGKWAFGIYYDAIKDWPDIMLQSAIMKWSAAIISILDTAKSGKLESREYLISYDVPDAAGIGTYHSAVPESVRNEVAAIIEDIKAGRIDPTK
jgi:basic membrane protein A